LVRLLGAVGAGLWARLALAPVGESALLLSPFRALPLDRGAAFDPHDGAGRPARRPHRALRACGRGRPELSREHGSVLLQPRALLLAARERLVRRHPAQLRRPRYARATRPDRP